MTEKKENKKSKITKDFYSTQELANAPWFPVKTADSVRRYIESGKLKAINVSTVSGKVKYQIPKGSVIEFMTNLV